MKTRTLIGMMIAGQELRDLMEGHLEAMAFVLNERSRDNLEAARYQRDIIGQFLIELDRPEDHDILRKTLHDAYQDLSDQVARCEEYVG